MTSDLQMAKGLFMEGIAHPLSFFSICTEISSSALLYLLRLAARSVEHVVFRFETS